jgi:hypothetical protein
VINLSITGWPPDAAIGQLAIISSPGCNWKRTGTIAGLRMNHPSDLEGFTEHSVLPFFVGLHALARFTIVQNSGIANSVTEAN